MVEVGNCTFKVQNGKMLKVTVEFAGDRIEKVHIRGDFFIHPEESLDTLEMSFIGTDYTKRSVSDTIKRIFAESGVVAFGITPKAVTDAIMNCKEVSK